MKDEKSMWPPVLVKYFGPMLTIKGALTFLFLGFATVALCLWIDNIIRTP